MARALYIHWPFCLKKCPYCDFNSHVRSDVDEALWKDALLADMRHEAGLAGGESLTSIFFGGGTPSLMPEPLVAALLAEAERLWGFDPDIEITLEANPTSFERAKFAGFRAAGVNRVSVGVQSLRQEALHFLGREHSVDGAKAAVGEALELFERVTFDLIYARPSQTEAEWEAELAEALAFGTDHLSLYQLTIEPGTRFATDVRQRAFTPLEDDPAADLFELTQAMTRGAGMPAYETSNHARPGQESRHNLTYWRYQDYAGIGPGAHGRRGGMATQRHKKPENWLSAVARNGHGLHEERALVASEAASEALLMGLRLAEGVDLAALSARFKRTPDQLVDTDAATRLGAMGLVETDGAVLRVTPAGRPVLDAILAEIVSDALVAA
ncbi:radical SAM family heme chaperone HemW [Paraurantiacibacter namhicola]|uniref:Heme chaperone HemW n=1 Tax=Paraurantiacibacter namhicola TaxID=645517 RepID=A0A1C7D940_9SPHN|nr:radical SAM family heme chaperone HemW [Paraurantiacibacter namhicola]ANU07999.1 Oxygen-independent coproporphyrinogen-III oxidase 1 [Paraurantiacibacter namhicola]